MLSFIMLTIISTCTFPHLCSIIITRKCMTLWGDPERIHKQNMEQLHAYDCHLNVTETQATEIHTHVHTGTVRQPWL